MHRRIGRGLDKMRDALVRVRRERRGVRRRGERRGVRRGERRGTRRRVRRGERRGERRRARRERQWRLLVQFGNSALPVGRAWDRLCVLEEAQLLFHKPRL